MQHDAAGAGSLQHLWVHRLQKHTHTHWITRAPARTGNRCKHKKNTPWYIILCNSLYHLSYVPSRTWSSGKWWGWTIADSDALRIYNKGHIIHSTCSCYPIKTLSCFQGAVAADPLRHCSSAHGGAHDGETHLHQNQWVANSWVSLLIRSMQEPCTVEFILLYSTWEGMGYLSCRSERWRSTLTRFGMFWCHFFSSFAQMFGETARTSYAIHQSRGPVFSRRLSLMRSLRKRWSIFSPSILDCNTLHCNQSWQTEAVQLFEKKGQ